MLERSVTFGENTNIVGCTNMPLDGEPSLDHPSEISATQLVGTRRKLEAPPAVPLSVGDLAILHVPEPTAEELSRRCCSPAWAGSGDAHPLRRHYTADAQGPPCPAAVPPVVSWIA
jgi:hypothetical protein